MANKAIRTKKSAKTTNKSARAAHPDKRLPAGPGFELLCKWIDASNGYKCKKVPVGGNW